jgi:hypothetical protein
VAPPTAGGDASIGASAARKGVSEMAEKKIAPKAATTKKASEKKEPQARVTKKVAMKVRTRRVRTR